jgi:type I restriction enzyme S subunit
MGHIQHHHLSEAMVTVPSADVMHAADEILAPLIERAIANNLESRTPAELIDTPLPKLLSGEVRMTEAMELAGGTD